MGTWASPTTVNKADELARLMSAPLSVREAEEKLYSLMGDDTLFDMIALARSFHSDTDVRGIVAAVLDEWLNWTPRNTWVQPWEPGADDKLSGLLDGLRDEIGEDDVVHLMCRFGSDDARRIVSEVLDLQEADASKLKVDKGFVSGTYVVTALDGRLFRFDRVYGVTIEAPEALANGLAERLQEDGKALSPSV